jgi:hypothetical protein
MRKKKGIFWSNILGINSLRYYSANGTAVEDPRNAIFIIDFQKSLLFSFMDRGGMDPMLDKLNVSILCLRFQSLSL